MAKKKETKKKKSNKSTSNKKTSKDKKEFHDESDPIVIENVENMHVETETEIEIETSDQGVAERASSSTFEGDSLLSQVTKEIEAKKTVEETHTRTTFLFRNDLKERFEDLIGDTKGIKTELFNRIMEEFIEHEEAKKKKK